MGIISGTSATNQQLPTTTTTQYPVPSDQRRGTMNHVATTRSTSVTVGTRTNYTRYARGRANTNTNTNTTTMKYNNNNNKTPRKRTKQIEKGRRKKKNLCVLGKGWKEVCGLEPRGIGLPFLSVCYKNTN